MSLSSDIKSFYQRSGIVMRYILMNLVVFVALTLLQLVSRLSGGAGVTEWLVYLSAPSDPTAFVYQPWSAFTYMFVHIDPIHFIFNMIMLYFVGMVFTDMLGSRKLPGVYILGGLSGFLVYFLAYNLSPAFKNQPGLLMGASGSIMAVFVAVGSFRPQYQLNLLLFGPVKLYVLVLIYVLIDLARLGASVGNPMGNSGGWLAHIGGAGFGFWFGYAYRKSTDITGWFDNLRDRINGGLSFKKRRKKKTVIKTHTATGAFRSNSPHMSRSEKQEKIDRILDKISKGGYESLTAGEKEFLFKNSKDV